MDEPAQQQKIDRLGDWVHLDSSQMHSSFVELPSGACYPCGWNPFKSHGDAHMLLEEIERRGRDMLWKVENKIYDLSVEPKREDAMLLATPVQVTDAVYAVAFPEADE